MQMSLLIRFSPSAYSAISQRGGRRASVFSSVTFQNIYRRADQLPIKFNEKNFFHRNMHNLPKDVFRANSRFNHLRYATTQSSNIFQSLDDTVIMTKSCSNRIRKLSENRKSESLRLRLSVEGGGCSGFQYTFTMDEGKNASQETVEKDYEFGLEGAKVVIDEVSLEFVKGATVDFQDDMMRSAFVVINNPNSENACGCGSSFALKSFEANPAKD